MSSFNGRVIAITGAASGIGLATAHILASRGANLSIADVNAEALRTVEMDLKFKFPSTQVLSYVLDVRKEDQVAGWIGRVMEVFGRLDGAANLAGVIGKSIGIKGIAELDVEEWDFILDVNLKGVMLCLKHELGVMKVNASIVNASSIAGVVGMPNNAAYTASKHAVIGLTRSAAKEVGGRGVRVNAICPGYIDTPMSHKSREIQDANGNKDARDSKIKSVALGRGGKAEECAELIVYLLSDGASFITGNAVSVDGGWNC
ncbi:NAD(P)-binding protein [Clathrospora elynae]|uniref:NAD(P)-binding protein n=1 Tax=Clathrospora elynae TaxID=706981 RepID=A0A6A5SJ72_9PLEO|nr:NAD(P)-binding protein [Clathrospora elynae]